MTEVTSLLRLIMKGQDLETVNDNLLERGLKPLYKE